MRTGLKTYLTKYAMCLEMFDPSHIALCLLLNKRIGYTVYSKKKLEILLHTIWKRENMTDAWKWLCFLDHSFSYLWRVGIMFLKGTLHFVKIPCIVYTNKPIVWHPNNKTKQNKCSAKCLVFDIFWLTNNITLWDINHGVCIMY